MGNEGSPLQHNMFTGELVDNRNRRQRKYDTEKNHPQQIQMFSLKETVQLGIQARPWLNNLPRPQMVLEREDIRTDEERERDLLKEAQALTGSLFANSNTTTETVIYQEPPPAPQIEPPTHQNTDHPQHTRVEGHRVQARRASVRDRIRSQRVKT